jgi:DNA primase catalytic core
LTFILAVSIILFIRLQNPSPSQNIKQLDISQTMNTLRNEQISELAQKANIVEIAEKLGLHVGVRQTASTKVLCPFHDDHNPSLQLYRDSNKFHCFVCGAHGDVYDLIKKCKNCDFREALEWLAKQYAFPLISFTPSPQNVHTPESYRQGLIEAELTYKEQDKLDQNMLSHWATKRNLPQEFLKQSGVYGAKGNKLSRKYSKDRETLENLINAGLVFRNKSGENKTPNQKTFFKDSPYDLFSINRIVFSLHDADGVINGFAGRAYSESNNPKYLYSKGFSRSKTLYRFHEVRRKIREDVRIKNRSANEKINLFVVEGLVDALRLEYLGLYTVAILGTALTQNQIKLICDLSEEIDRKNQTLVIHLFFDSDDPGQQAMEKALIDLLHEAGSKSNFLIDVVCPNIEGKKDPDEIFRDTSDNKINIDNKFIQWSFSPIEFLIARKLGIDPSNMLFENWSKQPSGDRFAIKRSIERNFLDYSILQNLVNREILFINNFTGKSRNECIEELKNFFAVNRTTLVEKSTAYSYKQGYSNETSLLHALQVAQASTQRREFPIDQGSWDRLQRTFGLIQFWMEEKLHNPQFGRSIQTEPMLAIKIPRQDKDYRNKALPCPEDLVLQQYMLNELLKEVELCPDFHLYIPAVRYFEKRIVTTYDGRELPTVSFAYQVDMEVLEGRIPPRNEGMYREYYACWSSFIQYIDDRIMRCPFEQFHVARLDIRRYYDQLHRDAVYNVLFPALETALKKFNNVNLAILFDSERNDRISEDRASRIVDWFIDHSFGYNYYDPKDGQKRNSDFPNHGIPQGPDLSAYLANIALFPLDNIMRKKIDKLDEDIQKNYGNRKYGGVYARYVDDIIIIVPSESQLQELKNTVSDHLARLGLELNQKTEPFPPMSKSEVVGWLTDRRGGLGVSGPFAGPLDTPPILHLDPLIDAGEIDRSDSLAILHNSTLDNPITEIDEILESVKTALLADELRHGDYCLAAMRVWACVCRDQENDINIDDLFLKYWNRCISADSEKQGLSLRHYLAALDGIERFLQRQPHRNPTLPEDSREIGFESKQTMAQYILKNRLDRLESLVDEKDELNNFQHMIKLKKMCLISQAKKVMSDKDGKTKIPVDFIPNGIADYSSLARYLFSLAEVFNNSTQIQNIGVQNIPILKFHFSVTLLSIYGQSGNTGTDRDPLSVINDSENGTKLDNILNHVIRWWMVDDETKYSNDTELWKFVGVRVISIFVELVGDNLFSLLQQYKRSKISQKLLFCTNCKQSPLYDTCHIIPAPAKIGIPGIVGYCECPSEGEQNVFLCKMPCTDSSNSDENDFTPNTLSWRVTPKVNENNNQHRRYALLNSWKLLDPKLPEGINRPQWIAEVFRALADVYKEKQEKICPPTAYNIIYDGEKNNWNVLGFNVPVKFLTSQAFIRSGNYRLRAEPVPVIKDYLWRIGTAIADYLDLIDYSNSQPWIKLSLPKIDPEQWAEQSMVATALTRLRGKYISDQSLKCDEKSGLPYFIERVLTKLEEFPKDNEIDKMAFRLAMIAEGRAFYYLFSNSIDLSISGGPSAVLADIVVNTLYHDENISAFFAEYDEMNTDISQNAPQRRAALAWFNLSKRFHWLDEQYSLSSKNKTSPDKSDPTIQCLQVASLLQAFQIEVRAKTLELWQILTPEQKIDKTKQSYHIAELELNTDLLLVHGSEINHNTEETQTELDPVQDLFSWLYKSTQDNTATSYNYLKRITPLGWTILWGVLGNYIPNNILENNNGITFKKIVSILSLCENSSQDDNNNDNNDPPWGTMLPIVKQFVDNYEIVSQLFGFLNNDDKKRELHILHKEKESFAIQGLRGKEKNVTLANKEYSMPSWAIIDGRFLREYGYETVKEKSGLAIQRHLFRWSETRYKGKLLSISVVGKGLASVSGLDKLDVSENPLTSSEKPFDKTLETDNTLVSEKNQNDSHDVEKNNETKNIEKESTTNIENHENKLSSLAKDDSFDQDKLLADQKDYWKLRSHKYQNHVRVAFLQWKVDETYCHPIFDLFKEIDDDETISNLCKEKKKDALSTSYETQFKPSRVEFRRRQIIKEVLEVCAAFNVDILLLPEYSVRPETLQFIWDTLRKQPQSKSNPAYKGTVVWAGTFRKPSDMTGYRISQHLCEQFLSKPTLSSILSVINPTEYGRPFFVRGKKYPSLAVDEIFFPNTNLYEPLFTFDKISSDSQFIPWIHTFELICSESFLATSPSNLRSIAQSYDMLLRKFGVIDSSLKRAEKAIKNDLYQFSCYTSLNSGHLFRRTILLLPAMSNRTQDYTLLGQSLYLSTGITTVFCNAAGSEGHGRSCFIGQDCWDIEMDIPKEPIDRGPYHGVFPGIFRQNSNPRGHLDKEEQAIVIADIDPLYAIPGQPRPQVLPPSLSLVAHIPIIEDRDIGNTKGKKKLPPDFWTSFEKIFTEIRNKRNNVDVNFAHEFHTVLLEPSEVEKVCNFLEKLKAIVGETGKICWMNERLEGFKKHHKSHPLMLPPPVAIDWIWVHTKPTNEDIIPEIEIPPYSCDCHSESDTSNFSQ